MAGEIAGIASDTQSLLLSGAYALSKDFMPIARNLTLAFSTLLLIWTGIKMMMERNIIDNLILGDAIKLVLLIGFVLGLLGNYVYLGEVLKESIAYILSQIGVDEKDIAKSLLETFAKVPAAMSSELDKVEFEVSVDLIETAFSYVVSCIVIGLFYIFSLIATIFISIKIVYGMSLFGIVLAVGPICIPFLLIPKMDKIFWSWIDGLVYSLSLKLTIGVSVIILSKLFLNAVPKMLTVVDGALSIDYSVLYSVTIAFGITILLFKQVFVIAGIFAGTRLAISDK